MYKHFIKRFLDIVFSLTAIAITLPFMVIIAVVCAITFKGQIFFIQDRVGKNGAIFRLYKFITMRPQPAGKDLADTERLTAWGNFLRKSSLDELPQLFHILIGDMSLIGPRPLLVRYIPYYTSAEWHRHDVKPGLTGLAQINGRNTLDWEARLNFDVVYAASYNFKMDLEIFIQTFIVVLKRSKYHIDPRTVVADFDIERKGNQIHISEGVILRPLYISDAGSLLEVKNNKEASVWLEKDPPVYTKEGLINWIRHHQSNPNNLILIIEDTINRKVIGHAGLYDINPEDGTCIFGILIGLPEYWGKGIGRAATSAMIQIAFNTPGIQTIKLHVLQINERAISLYRSMGFTNEEVFVDQTIKNGEPQDVICMKMFNHAHNDISI
ncbi:MAG TPA: GNAT family N-acetyltransferase [Chitinophagales bacterium]|nr:GNAT family N-acetyltransferase [Chitinophagales bacterium]HNM29472.1 GNAT family N-acetyltransferase [Chitinophagales bacterium]HNO28558.1 GNAT family N-acetyltransferase [Chitinophagales bacterium]